MKKYKIKFQHYDKNTRALKYEEVLTTKPIDEDKLESIIRLELQKENQSIWSVSPYPKKFEERFK